MTTHGDFFGATEAELEAEEALLFPLTPQCACRTRHHTRCTADAPFIVHWPGSPPSHQCGAHANVAVNLAMHVGFELVVEEWAARRATIVQARRAAFAAAALTGQCPRQGADGQWRLGEHAFDEDLRCLDCGSPWMRKE